MGRGHCLVTLDLDRKVPDSPFLFRDAGGGSQTYKSNFYSEELTVQYLKESHWGNTFLLAPSHGVCVCGRLHRRGGQQMPHVTEQAGESPVQ